MWLPIPNILLASVVGWTCCKTLRTKSDSQSQKHTKRGTWRTTIKQVCLPTTKDFLLRNLTNIDLTTPAKWNVDLNKSQSNG